MTQAVTLAGLASTNTLYADSSGNVGIGTSSPSSFGKFAVVGSNTGGAIVNYFSNSWTTATANTQVVLSLDPGGNGYGVRDCQIRAINNGGNQNSLTFYTSNAATPVEALRIDYSGNVGIGTTSPAYKLHVVSSADRPLVVTTVTDTPAVFQSTTANSYIQLKGTGADVYLGNVSGSATITANGAERMRIDSSGRVTTPYQPAFFAQLNNTTIYSTIGTIPFTRIGTNIGSCYNASTYRFTAPVAGTYAFYFKGFIESATRSSVNISVNGTSKQGIYGPQSQGDMLFGNLIVTLAANDYVTVDLRQGNVFGDGGGVNNDAASFSGYLLG